jgi:hypothetical protein
MIKIDPQQSRVLSDLKKKNEKEEEKHQTGRTKVKT